MQRLFLSFNSDDEFDLDDQNPPDTNTATPETEQHPIITKPHDPYAQISLHAMCGSTDPATIRIQGHLANHQVTVLTDSQSFWSCLHIQQTHSR